MAVFIVVLAALILPFVPFLVRLNLRLVLSLVGRYLQRSTEERRQSLLASIPASKGDSSSPPKSPSYTSVEDEEDWEKVDGEQNTPSKSPTPNVAFPSKTDASWTGVIGFFHPFCNAGGGGERVLWAAIRATQLRWPNALCIVYTGDHDVDRTLMVKSVERRFGIVLRVDTLQFIYLNRRHLVLATTYPHFTLLGQSLGSVGLAWESFNLLVPDIFIDTMGYTFTLAFCKYLFPAVPTAAYVHYPTISTDMLESLDDSSGERGLNSGAGAGTKGKLKRQYWHLFAKLYSWAGSHVDVVMCNSSWTRGHISALWKPTTSAADFAAVVYPPCPVEEFEGKIDVSASCEKNRQGVLYIAQFRAEKNHSLILRAFEEYFKSLSAEQQKNARLTLIGSVRSNSPDEKHIYKLRVEARERGINDVTTFICDAKFSTIQEHLQKASIGVNGMWNEHFGIGVVEYLAAGLIPVVHDSGGPKLDIVVPYDDLPTGYHAETHSEFAECFRRVDAMSADHKLAMRLRGRQNAKRFGEEQFASKWVAQMEILVKNQANASLR